MNVINKLNVFKLLKPENIDRIKVEFTEDTQYKNTEYEIYAKPVVYIVKNSLGKKLFNEYVDLLDYKEKGASKLGEDLPVPYYILNADLITAGCHFGVWKYFDNIDELNKEVTIDQSQNDFEMLKNEMLKALDDMENKTSKNNK